MRSLNIPDTDSIWSQISSIAWCRELYDFLRLSIYSHLSRSCHGKCISTRYADGELNKGESVCIDRCVAKFNEVQKKVGEKLQSKGANAAANNTTSAFGSL
jgi:hypothetical protein